MPDDIAIDLDARTARIFGINYSLDLFRMLAIGPIGTLVRIVSRDNGTVALEAVQEADNASG